MFALIQADRLSFHTSDQHQIYTIGWSALETDNLSGNSRSVLLRPFKVLLFKGGDPAARSRTATLLRLHPSHRPHRGKRPPEG
jgi:hypothetical protein